LGEQQVLNVTLESAFHAFSLSTLSDVKFLRKNVIHKSVKPMYFHW
jgi:hypothetical protein